MEKIFNVLGISALVSTCFLISSCETSYDEEELDRDIQKKLEAMKDAGKVNSVTYGANTFSLPVKVTPELHGKDDLTYIGQWPFIPGFSTEPYYTYFVDSADAEAIKQSLYEQSAALSEYGNFILDRAETGFTYGTPLKDALTEVKDKDNGWFFLGKDRKLYTIKFFEESDGVIFKISDSVYPLEENDTVAPPN